ncbi:MAG: restriction endonuclease [Bacillota bacterium]|nr:restriction endonuclease [Bacillota bacterium]
MENRRHWIFKKHTNSITKLVDVALYLKSTKSSISSEDKEKMYDEFSRSLMYNPRDSIREKPIDAMSHRIRELNYYMFGYSDKIDGEEKFIFSPLGNLFLKYLSDSEKIQKIFATMLFSIQFPHPASFPSENFYLYPFRLIFKLLLDERLGGKLYNFEIYRFIIYLDKISEETYERLVSDILLSRKLADEQKFQYLKNNEAAIVKSTYEWQYYVSKLLEDAKIIKRDMGDKTVDLYHPQKPKSKSKPTKRKINNGYFSLNLKLVDYIESLLQEYSFLANPIILNDSKRGSSDVVKEIYSFYPDILLKEIGEEINQIQTKMLRLPKLIDKYSNNPNNETSDLFEDILEEAFNMFINIEAKKLSGAGRTDIECLYLTISQKFAVEAKSTSNKLVGINAGRLKRHRKIIGAKYTIVVTPRYVPSVQYDIEDQNIVIIKANTLSEYFYNNIISNNRNMDYGEIHEIVINNLGTDVSLKISELTLAKFG